MCKEELQGLLNLEKIYSLNPADLCFTVSVRTNKFALKQLDRYSPEQEEVFQKIKSLHESGLGYRKIAHHLNENGLISHNGKSGEVIMFIQVSKDKRREKKG